MQGNQVAATAACGFVPVIDLSSKGTDQGRVAIAEAIDQARVNSGFFVIVGHGPHVVVSATDPYAPANPRAWSAALNLDCDVLPAAGHITPEDGYGPWPAALAWCLREQTPVSAATGP
ncbi:2-oxoglutarate and iron-dependent oxygenase domain-containing protein [Streptomyces sp. 11-1-2]|uniref:alpha/beta hydrolase n=1 Tax=unclassified Streptomyces TaxID=2593676 RepID=UPI000E747988|nr:2-oxoglutarate and iron-dependent oxygenase domain-containing protein [Streptomyces sp. 11-1-2]